MQVETNLRTPDTPWDFAEQKQIGVYRIEYKDLREFSQGSPLIGFLYINNEQIFCYCWYITHTFFIFV